MNSSKNSSTKTVRFAPSVPSCSNSNIGAITIESDHSPIAAVTIRNPAGGTHGGDISDDSPPCADSKNDALVRSCKTMTNHRNNQRSPHAQSNNPHGGTIGGSSSNGVMCKVRDCRQWVTDMVQATTCEYQWRQSLTWKMALVFIVGFIILVIIIKYMKRDHHRYTAKFIEQVRTMVNKATECNSWAKHNTNPMMRLIQCQEALDRVKLVCEWAPEADVDRMTGLRIRELRQVLEHDRDEAMGQLVALYPALKPAGIYTFHTAYGGVPSNVVTIPVAPATDHGTAATTTSRIPLPAPAVIPMEASMMSPLPSTAPMAITSPFANNDTSYPTSMTSPSVANHIQAFSPHYDSFMAPSSHVPCSPIVTAQPTPRTQQQQHHDQQ